MNLQIIAGPSGAGKSTYIYQKIIDEATKPQNRKKHYLILVPLQYSMETQRILVFMSPHRSIMNIDVLSFERLAYRVFDELGTQKTRCLDETGKVLLLRRAASLIRDDLGILGSSISRRGYIDEVKSLVSELMQYGYEPDDVESMAGSDGVSSTFRAKACDVEKLYREFLTLFDESMFTQEQVLSLLCEVAERSDLIRDSVIVLDGYTGFTPVQKELLRRIFPLVDTIYACVTCDADTDLYRPGREEDLFHMSEDEAYFLTQLAGEHLSDPVIIDRGAGRFRGSDAISFVEENLFRESGKSYRGDDRAVSLLRTRDVNTEILYTAEKIHQMIREDESLHYRDFAVICTDTSVYRYAFARIYEACGIPVFVDERNEAQFNPLTEFIDASLDMVKRRLSYDTLMRFLRSGLTPLSADETDVLDNYLYEAAFRNASYLGRPFVRHTADFRSDDDMASVNAIREKISEPVMAFYNSQKGRNVTVRQRLAAIFSLMTSFGVEQKLRDRADIMKEASDMVSEDLYRRIYGLFCDLADEMVSLLGDERMSISDFMDMLLDGLDEIKPATVPKSNDTVIFGDLERTRLSDVRVIFLIGAGDDQIPLSSDAIGIFSQEDRRLLKAAGFELAPTDAQKSADQRFYLYLALTKASRQIFISYHEAASDGSGIGASYLFEEIQNMFPGTVTDDITMSDDVFLETENSADIILASGIRDLVNEAPPHEVMDLTRTLLDIKDISGQSDKKKAFIDAAFFENTKTALKQAVTEALFGKSLLMSVSRLETFAKCAYSYFLNYGLGLVPRRINEFASLDLGNLYHGTLEKYAMGLKSDNTRWTDVSENEMRERLRRSFEAEIADFGAGEIFSDAREAHFAEQAYANLCLNTQIMTQQIAAGTFEPAFFEMELSRLCTPADLIVPIGRDRTLSLTGKIDRIDIAQTADTDYIKIIDYKTGRNDIDPVKIYSGLQLQLLVYMNAALDGIGSRSRKKVLPGAVFYYELRNTRIDEDHPMSDADLMLAIEKDLRPSGLMIDDPAVIGALDGKLVTEKSYHSPYVKLNTVTSGKLGSSGAVVSAEDFEAIRLFTRDRAASLGTQIADGVTSRYPYKEGDYTGCTYCLYRSVCHFDPRLRGFYYNDITKSLDEVSEDGKKPTKASRLRTLVERITMQEGQE